MPLYSYVARTNAGKKVQGSLYANTETDLADKLASSDQLLISASVPKVTKAKKGLHLKPAKVLSFTMNLASFVKGGLPLVEGLNALIQDTADEDVSSLSASLKDFVEAGGSFKDALLLHPKVFSEAYIAIISSGEKTGKLDVALEDVANYLEWSLNLKAKITELAMYPVMICVVMIGVLGVLVGWVLPKFEPMLAEMGTDLPAITKIVLGTSRAFNSYWYIFVIVIVFIMILAKILLKNPILKRIFDKWKLKLPVMGDLVYKLCLSRFAHLMDICTGSGISIVESLDLGQQLIGNKYLDSSVEAVSKTVVSGGELTAGMKRTGAFPPFMVRMVGVGERSGDLAKGFNTVSRFYDKEIPRVIQKVFAVIEPLLIVFMGVVVGGISMSVFLPLLKMSESIG